MEQIPTYLTIKKVIEVEEFYTVKDNRSSALSKERLEAGLLNGDLNIVQVATCEPIAWIVDRNGKRVAVLEKDGGCGPSEEVRVEASFYEKSDYELTPDIK